MHSIIAWTIYCAIAQVWDESDIGNMPEERDMLTKALHDLDISLTKVAHEVRQYRNW